jgi:hypothetical protein
MAVDRLKNLRRLRELRKPRRATRVGCHNGRCQDQEPTKFAPLVELQQDCDAVERALEDEAAVAKDGDLDPSAAS